MNKGLRELLNQINNKKAEAKRLANENKIEEAKAAKEELVNLQAKFDVLCDLEDEAEEEIKNKIENGEAKEVTNKKKDSIKEFANAARNGFKASATIGAEGTPGDGGYTVPEDIQTKINEYRDAEFSLKDLVRVEKVTTYKGSRTFKKREQQTGFAKVGEKAKIQGKNTPQFERIEYTIDKYAGYFPVTNELLSDSDANIANTLITWIGDESRATANKLILTKIKEANETDLKDLDGIKKALNVTLGQAFKGTSKIITNDNGLQYLDTLKDSDGKYLLQPNPANPMELRLCAGSTVVPIVVIPNSILANGDSNKVPFIIGDLKEGIMFWDRQLTTIKMSTEAAIGELNAYEEDLTLFRAIERENVTFRDKSAIVNGYITVLP